MPNKLTVDYGIFGLSDYLQRTNKSGGVVFLNDIMAVQPKRRPFCSCYRRMLFPKASYSNLLSCKTRGGLVWKEPGCNVSNPELPKSAESCFGRTNGEFCSVFFIFGLPPRCDPGKRIWRKMERKRMAQLTIRHLKKVAIQLGALRISSYRPWTPGPGAQVEQKSFAR